jgi:hypothetical protein
MSWRSYRLRGHGSTSFVLPSLNFLGTVCFMESTPFEFTPAQKGLLESLSRETGKPVSALIDKALEGLREDVRHEQDTGDAHGSDEAAPARPPQEPRKPIWQQFAEAFKDVPEEELARLPADGAAQHDHYIYGLPKRPA